MIDNYLMHRYDPHILLPASEAEIRQFCNKLDSTAGNFAIQDGWHTAIEIERSVTLEDGSIRYIKFETYIDDDTDVFEIVMSERYPMNGNWDQNVVATLLGEDYIGLNTSDAAKKFADENNVEIDETGFTEGYLEREKITKLYKSRACAVGMLAFNINIMDDSFTYLDCEVGYSPGAFTQDDIEAADLEKLFSHGESILNTNDLENNNSVVTRVDILVATEALKGAGIMHPLVVPYKNAPRLYGELDFYTINGDKL